MELLQLKYFCDAAQSENFSVTAKKFGVPPSNISQSIKRLENELSVSLFVRRANSVSLNDQGKVFFEKIKAALELIEDAKIRVSDDGVSGKIKLAINTNRRMVMQTVDKYRRKYENVDILIKHGIKSGIEDFNLLIEDDSFKNKELKWQKILSEKICLAVKKDSPIALKDKITKSDIENASFITMSNGNNLRNITQQICKDFGFVPHIAIQSDDPFYIRKCVELGLGIAVVPTISWQGQFSDDVILKNIGEYSRNTYVYWDDKKYMSGCVKKFLEMLINECSLKTNIK